MDELTSLRAISPLDGRYGAQLFSLGDYFSEYGLFKFRLFVEIEYLIELSRLRLPQMPNLNDENITQLREIHSSFFPQDAIEIKKYENTTNHDIKALEYFIHDKLKAIDIEEFKPWVHFGLTSQDINNTAVPLSCKYFIHDVYIPELQNLISTISANVQAWKVIPMLARTHGQPASPTILGKEIAVFQERLIKQLDKIRQFSFEGKFGGATGNFNAQHAAFLEIEWTGFADAFLSRLGLARQQTTTQIEHYDSLAELFDMMARINTILLDLCRDMWLYISFNYFSLAVKEGEVGSSAMPHKVNPIDFENAEGNIGLANALFNHLSAKLPVSRMQRDLSDSTVLRNVGVPMGHSMLALKSIQKGMAKCLPNEVQISKDLEDNAVVLAEAYQVVLRREGVPDGYEILKALTRHNTRPTLKDMHHFIEGLPIAEHIKQELRQLTPSTYTGILPPQMRS